MSRGGPDGRRWKRLPHIPRGDSVRDGEEELRFHLEMRVQEYVARGMTEEEARAAAEARLGNMDEVRDEMERIARTETRAGQRRERISDLWQDIRYGVRVLRRAPTFTSMSVLTLALGIGATTAIFSLVYAVLLAPLPYPEPDRLVRLWETSPQGATRNVVSSGNVVDWQARARSFTVIGAHQQPFPVTLTDDGEAALVVQAAVQPEVLRALDAVPALGRSLADADAVDGDVVLIAHALWRDRYGSDPSVLGRRIALNDIPYTVIGVLPPDFAYPNDEVVVWRPLTDAALDPNERTSHNYEVLARLAAGSTVESAQREMTGIAEQIAGEHPAPMTGWGANVVPLHGDITRNVASLFWVLLGGVGVVLLIACGNLANLLLARAVARQREIAVRGALGAGRARILRQLLTESGLLALFGTIGALLLAPLLLRVLVASAPPDIPFLDHAAVDLRMLAFTATVAIACAALFGIAPAARLSRSDLETALRSGRDASQAGHMRMRGALLVAQVSLSVVLLVGAGLFVRSFRALQSVDLGFDPARLVLMDVNLPQARYGDIQRQVTFYEQLVERVARAPGVTAAAGTSQPPGTASGMTFSFAIEGRVAANPSGREDDETLHAVTPGYFELLGQRIVAGRSFEATDRADGSPVVIINESLARKHFPDGDAVGHRLAFRVGETPWREIVGVVADARLESPDVAPDPGLFIPFAQKTWPWLTWTTVVARTAPGTDPAVVAADLRDALGELDPSLPPQSIGTVSAAFRENTARRTFAMTLVGGFAALALTLSIVGLYGLISYSVARQRREIGVRIALGAASGDVVGGVLRRSILLTLVGAGAGVVVAVATSRALESLLFGVSALDATTYVATVGLVVVVALATALLPALRAAHTDPSRALQSD